MSENHTHFHMASKVIFQTLWKYTKTWRSLRSIFAYFFGDGKKWQQELLVEY